MAGSEAWAELYLEGKSIPEVSEQLGIPRSTVRFRLARKGILRSRADGVRAAVHKIAAKNRGKAREFSAEHKAAIADGRAKWGEANARGTSLKPSGYIEITRGENKGRSQHVVAMEARIGRKILPDEVVHHIDGNRSNNSIDNLALMTRAAHMRLHCREKRIAKGK